MYERHFQNCTCIFLHAADISGSRESLATRDSGERFILYICSVTEKVSWFFCLNMHPNLNLYKD